MSLPPLGPDFTPPLQAPHGGEVPISGFNVPVVESSWLDRQIERMPTSNPDEVLHLVQCASAAGIGGGVVAVTKAVETDMGRQLIQDSPFAFVIAQTTEMAQIFGSGLFTAGSIGSVICAFLLWKVSKNPNDRFF